jgi:hypothetical protein
MRRLWAPPLLAAMLAACPGPRPSVERVSVEHRPQEGLYRLSVTVRNGGRGEGQAEVTARLRDRESGRLFQKDDHVALGPRQQVMVTIDIEAPPGDYEPFARAEYPPR